MLVFLDRSKRADSHLEWKVRLFSVAAVVGLCGIYFDDRWLTGGAIVLLAGAILLRLLPSSEGEASPAEVLDEGEDAGG